MKDPLNTLTNFYLAARKNGLDKHSFARIAIDLVVKDIFPLIDWPKIDLVKSALYTYWSYGGYTAKEKVYADFKLSKGNQDSNAFMLQDWLQHMSHLAWFLDLFAVCHYDGRNSYRSGFVLKPGKPKEDDQDLVIILKDGTVIINPRPAYIVEGYGDCVHYPTIHHYHGYYDEHYLYDYFGFFGRLTNARLVKANFVQNSINAIKNSNMPIIWGSVNV